MPKWKHIEFEGSYVYLTVARRYVLAIVTDLVFAEIDFHIIYGIQRGVTKAAICVQNKGTYRSAVEEAYQKARSKKA